MSSSGESKQPTDKHSADESANAVKTSPSRKTLSKIAHYALLGLAPVIAISALIVAMSAIMDSKSQEEHLGLSNAKIETLNSSLLLIKSELEKLKLSNSQDKQLQEDTHNKQETRISILVQNITLIQVKLKISPTLEEQLRQTVISGVVPISPVNINASSAVATPIEKQQSSQVKAMKEAIEKYNRTN